MRGIEPRRRARGTTTRGVLSAILLAIGLAAAAPHAQQGGQNVNVLPPYVSPLRPDGKPSDPDEHLKGDLFLQRQLEPSIAVSTRNPEHLIAFYNDYRAVDLASDIGIGEKSASTRGALPQFFAKLLRRGPKADSGPQPAAAEAFIGYSVSYNNGATWIGGLLPGSPSDRSPASLASPIYGSEAATDPVVMSAPCGWFYTAFIAFTRHHQSYLAIARYRDENNTDGGNDIRYVDTKVVMSGAASATGVFIDKPSLAVDVNRTGSADPCAHNVYAAFTVFDGLESNGRFRSKVLFARSTDSGNTYSKGEKESQPYIYNQGTALAVDPLTGHVYLMWRHFGDNPAMVVTKSTDLGGFFPKPIPMNGTKIESFDQPTVSAPATDSELAFRSNGFPTLTAAVYRPTPGSAPRTRLYAAWQERVGFTGCPDLSAQSQCGRPLANGHPRIVLMRSDDGLTWTDAQGVAGQRRAIDFADRVEHSVQSDFGRVEPRASGPQVMPRINFGGGRLMLVYYEARGGLAGSLPGGFITGLYRRMDLRAAQLDPATGAFIAGAQVSRYAIRAGRDFLPLGQGEEDLLEVGPGIPSVNHVNSPTSGGGRSPFIGDYVDLVPAVAFVRTATGWRHATNPEDVPSKGFHTVFADNRNQIPPTNGSAGYQDYSPPGTGLPSCINPGSRNTDVFTSRVKADVIAGAPLTFKHTSDIERAFPLYVTNYTAQQRFFRLTITSPRDSASFDQKEDETGDDPALDDELDTAILANSSVTRTVYLEPGTGATTISLAELTLTCPMTDPPVAPSLENAACTRTLTPGGLTASVTLNSDPSQQNPLLTNSELHNPLLSNPLLTNPLLTNPLLTNPLLSNVSKGNPMLSNPLLTNPLLSNPLLSNPLLTNASPTNPLPEDQPVYGITDVTWLAQNGGNTNSSYLSTIFLNNYGSLDQYYQFQLVIYRVSSWGGTNGCQTVNVPQDQIIANIPGPLLSNPLLTNPLLSNPLLTNPLLSNSTFYVAPADNAPDHSSHDGTKHAPRQPDAVRITLRAFQLLPTENIPPGSRFDPVANPPLIAVYAQSANVVNGIEEAFPPAVATATATTLVTSAPLGVVGQPLTLTATVQPVPVGPNLTVEFFDGTTSLGTAPLNAQGVATLTTSALTLEPHDLSARFLGSSGFPASTSSVVTQHMIERFAARGAFEALAGGSGPTLTQDFETFAANAPITTVLPGVLNAASTFATLQVQPTFSCPPPTVPPQPCDPAANNVMFGFDNTTRAAGNGRYDLLFVAPRSALGFDIAAQDPATGPARIQINTAAGSISFFHSNPFGENVANFFGAIATLPIESVNIFEGPEVGGSGNEEIVIDNITVGALGVPPGVSGQLHLNSQVVQGETGPVFVLGPNVGSWTQNVPQQFELTVNLDPQSEANPNGRSVSLAIDGLQLDMSPAPLVDAGVTDLSRIAVEFGLTSTQKFAWDDVQIVSVAADGETETPLFSGNFDGDTAGAQPGPPALGTWQITAQNGSILVRNAAGNLKKPVELAQFGGVNSVSLAGTVVGAAPSTGILRIRWRSSMVDPGESYDAGLGGVFVPVVIRGNGGLIAAVEYRGSTPAQ